LLRAYWEAFTSSDDVCLILKVYFGNFTDEATKSILRRISSFKEECRVNNTPRILVYGHDVPQHQMSGLCRTADCYVGTSREGFGITYAEAMACGIACIGPEVGGTRQFMTEENSFLVKYLGDEGVGPETKKMYPSFSGLRWAKHSWEHLSALMRQVVYDGKERQRRALLGMEDVRKDLSPETIGATMTRLLEESDGQAHHPDVLHERALPKDDQTRARVTRQA